MLAKLLHKVTIIFLTIVKLQKKKMREKILLYLHSGIRVINDHICFREAPNKKTGKFGILDWVGWSQICIKQLFYGIFDPLSLKIFGKFTVKVLSL